MTLSILHILAFISIPTHTLFPSFIMHQAIPYRSWRPDLHNPTTTLPLMNINSSSVIVSSPKEKKEVLKMVSENAVIVIGRKGCCMSHVVKRLLLGLGVNPAIYEVEDKDEDSLTTQLEATIPSDDAKLQFPAVFIGGNLFGGLDRIIASHISGELIPVLKQAGALWL